MLNSWWMVASAFTLLGGVLVILAPKTVVNLNKLLGKALVSADDVVMRYRHLVGAGLLVVAYLCFRLAMVMPGLVAE